MSTGIILPPSLISLKSKATRSATQMGSGEWFNSFDILGKAWPKFRPEYDTVACWDFTRGQGNPLHDLSERGNDLTVSGGVVRETGGPFGWNYSFPGTDDYLYVANNPSSLQIIGELTVEMICQLDALSNKTLISKYASSQVAWMLYYTTTNLVFITSSDGTTLKSTTINDAVAPIDTILHITGVFKPGQYQRLYINGYMVAEETSSIPSYLHNSTQNVEIGCFGGGSYDFDGNIYMARITPRTKTHREIWESGGRCY